MSPDSTRIRQLFEEASELDGETREQFLEDACGDDDALRAEVAALLEAAREADGFLDTLPPDLRREDLEDPLGLAGSDVGPYHIRSLLARGGMGLVYRAQQERPRRAVALKLIASVLFGPEARRRFEHEVEALGRLRHPAIAQIYDAGYHDVGGSQRPFIAMELIDGRPCHRFAADAGLDLKERVALIARIADGVHHAHEQGVIHRDLKPANVLVEASGLPKIIDFGVARVTNADLQATTVLTGTGQLLGTLPYMSPEQVSGGQEAIDTRTDVYALGVLAYQMLAGRLPLELAGHSLPEAIRRVAEVDAPPLRSGGTRFPEELETIIGKALAKERAQRYASAAALAEDLRRYLADEPILALPASRSYQIRRFARKNRALVGGVAATMLALALGLAGTGWALVEADGARRQAEREAERANSVSTFLSGLLRSPAPEEQGRDVRVADLLDAAGERLPEAFADRPELRGILQAQLGTTYYHLSLQTEAERELRAAIEAFESAGASESEEALEAASNLGSVLAKRGAFDEARELFARALAAADARGDMEPKFVLALLGNLAGIEVQRGDDIAAEPLLRRVLEEKQAQLGPDDPSTLIAQANIANLLRRQGELEEARALAEDVLARRRRLLGDEHPHTLVSMDVAAATARDQKDHARAEELARESVAISLEVLGERHTKTLIRQDYLGVILAKAGRPTDGEAVQAAMLAIARDVLPAGHPRLAVLESDHAETLILLERYDEARRQLDRCREVLAARLGPDSRYVVQVDERLAMIP